MSDEERLVADFRGTGMTVGPHPMSYHRARMERMGVRRAIELSQLPRLVGSDRNVIDPSGLVPAFLGLSFANIVHPLLGDVELRPGNVMAPEAGKRDMLQRFGHHDAWIVLLNSSDRLFSIGNLEAVMVDPRLDTGISWQDGQADAG